MWAATAARRRSILAAVHFGELTAPEQRVLGCLIEKRWTTPDQYPLSLNALRLACNQSTNRDPVTDYDEATVREAAQRLSHYGLARLASGHGSRATKYRHLAEEGLGLDRQQLALLCVLLLRGPQTPGELKGRSERMAPFATLAEVERVLGGPGRARLRAADRRDARARRRTASGSCSATRTPRPPHRPSWRQRAVRRRGCPAAPVAAPAAGTHRQRRSTPAAAGRWPAGCAAWQRSRQRWPGCGRARRAAELS